MSKTLAKWINFDGNTLEDNSTALRVKLETGAGLEATASGIRIKAGEVTDNMLAGSIAFSKLADSANIARLDQGETIVGLWNFTTQPTYLTNALATESYVDSALSGLDFQPDVLDKQIDGVVDPGAIPTLGDRYIVADPANANTNFKGAYGSVALWVAGESIGDNDIVEWDGTNFVVSYDVSVKGEGAITWNQAEDYFERYDGTSWDEFGGLSGITAGAGLSKTGNTLNVGAGNGITVNADTVEVKSDATGGANLAKAIDVNANGVAVKVDGDTIGEDVSGQLKVNGNSIGATELDETDTYDFSASGNVDVATQSLGNNTTKAASTAFVQSAISGMSSENAVKEMHLITAGEVVAGYFTLSQNPTSVSIVSLTPVGGPQQVSKQIVGATGVTPDFDVLSTNQLHFNNNGSATGLSEELEEGDVVIVEYVY